MDTTKLQEQSRSARLLTFGDTLHAAKNAKDRQAGKERITKIQADFIIKQIPKRMRIEAAAGRNFAIVMSLKENTDYKRLEMNKDELYCSSSWLMGTAKTVHHWCAVEDLRPTLEYWFDFSLNRGGFNIVVHW